MIKNSFEKVFWGNLGINLTIKISYNCYTYNKIQLKVLIIRYL